MRATSGMCPQEGADVERRRHARVSEAEAGGDDDAEDRAGEGAVGDGFGEEDAPVQVGERADEAAERSDEGDVQGGDDEEAEDHDASPAASVVATDVSRPVSRERAELSPTSCILAASSPTRSPVSRTVSRGSTVPRGPPEASSRPARRSRRARAAHASAKHASTPRATHACGDSGTGGARQERAAESEPAARERAGARQHRHRARARRRGGARRPRARRGSRRRGGHRRPSRRRRRSRRAPR